MGERKQIKLGLIGFGEVGSTLGKGLPCNASSASPNPDSWRNSASPCSGVRSSTAATSARRRSSSAQASALRASSPGLRKAVTSRASRSPPDNSRALSNTSQNSSGKASAKPSTSTVSPVDHGRAARRPRLENNP